LRGECRVISGVTVVTTLGCPFPFGTEAADALGIRHSLRPLISESGKFRQTSREKPRRDRKAVSLHGGLFENLNS
jgi:hypothetical protein